MTARLIDAKTVHVTFDNLQLIQLYCQESLDYGDIHSKALCAAFYDDYPEFVGTLAENPEGRMIIPGKLVESPAVGLFFQALYQGFLLGETETKQNKPVYFGDTVIYTLKEYELLKVTSKGLRVYRALVEATKDEAQVGTYKMVAFQHMSFPLGSMSFSPPNNPNVDAF